MPDEQLPPVPPTPDETSTDVDKWKALSRKNENEKKAALASNSELTLKIQELEAKVSNAEATGKSALDSLKSSYESKVSTERAALHARYAAKARGADADALLEGRDIKPFLKEDGSVNEDAITSWLDKVAPTKSNVNYGGGSPGSGATPDPGDKYANDPLAQLLKQSMGMD